MNNSKNVKKVIAVTSLSLLGVSSVTTPAMADVGGGVGGGGGPINHSGQHFASWKTVSTTGSDTAWNKFLREAKHYQNTVENEVRSRVGNIDVCKQSNRIWFVQYSGGWAFNFTGYTHGINWTYAASDSSTIEKPVAIDNSTLPNQSQINAFKNWDSQKNSNKIDKVPGYVIICSGSFENKETKKREKVVVTSDTTDNKDIAKWTEPISYTTEATPQIVDVNGNDPIGANNLHTQSNSVKTNFGAVYDKYSKSKDAKIEDINKDVQDAINKDKNLEHSKINLDNANKAGMAEGGVMNFSERTQYATITSSKQTRTIKSKKCVYTSEYDYKANRYLPEKESCTNLPDKVTTSYTSSTSKGTQKQTGFWQMLSVHCNELDFSNLIKSVDGARIVDSGDASKGISAVAVTKSYAQQPKNLDFGDTSNINIVIANNIYNNTGDKTARADRTAAGALNIALSKGTDNIGLSGNDLTATKRALSGAVGFYDKECPFDCTPSNKTNDGASKANGAIDNISNTSKAKYKNGVTSGGGATSTDNTGNVFEFFRDNEDNKLHVDVWYPKKTSVVKYNGEAPVTTTITRWAEGTPGVIDSNGGKFTFTSTNGNKELFTGSDEAKTQKNWDTSSFSNSTSTIIPGLHNDFTAKSTWASDANKPQKLNVKWEFAPQVSTNIYTNGVGFSKSGQANYGTISTVETPIQGKCYAYFDEMIPSDTKVPFHNNTGSGTVNNLDGNLLETGGNSNAELVINFVRAVSK